MGDETKVVNTYKSRAVALSRRVNPRNTPYFNGTNVFDASKLFLRTDARMNELPAYQAIAWQWMQITRSNDRQMTKVRRILATFGDGLDQVAQVAIRRNSTTDIWWKYESQTAPTWDEVGVKIAYLAIFAQAIRLCESGMPKTMVYAAHEDPKNLRVVRYCREDKEALHETDKIVKIVAGVLQDVVEPTKLSHIVSLIRITMIARNEWHEAQLT